MVASCVATLLTGCNAPETSGVAARGLVPDVVSEKGRPIWKDTKITDLAASGGGKRPVGQSLMTIDFCVYIFEIPAENISALDDVWQMLHTKPLRFNDYDAFGANSFLVGFGQIQMWNEIRDLLLAAGGKKIETVSLLLSDGQADDLTIAGLDNERTIFYISNAGSMEGLTIGPGKLVLRLKAEKIPGSRGVCNVDVLPVFPSPIKSPVPQLAAREKADEFLFTSAGFGLKMSPGDFIFLGPEKYVSHQITLDSLFFSRPPPATSGGRPGRRPVIRTYLLVCTKISG